MRHSLLTKALHGLLAVAVVHQLLVSLVMEEPSRRHAADAAFFLHQWVGMANLAVVVLFWVWTLARRSEAGIGAFFPWFSSARLCAIVGDLRAYGTSVLRLEMPDTDKHTAFPNAVHGLGLLVATLMAATGAVLFAQMGPQGELPAFGHAMKELHEGAGSLMWIYLIGHAAMALLHQIFGDGVLRKMWTVSG